MDNLSQKARKAYDQLQAKMQELVIADKKREPKLTEAEKVEIAELEKRIEYLKPVNERLEKLLEEKDARLKYLERNGQTLIIEGGDVDALIDELIRLKPAIQLLSEAYRTSLFESGQSGERIKNIKNAARQRELTEEVGQ